MDPPQPMDTSGYSGEHVPEKSLVSDYYHPEPEESVRTHETNGCGAGAEPIESTNGDYNNYEPQAPAEPEVYHPDEPAAAYEPESESAPTTAFEPESENAPTTAHEPESENAPATAFEPESESAPTVEDLPTAQDDYQPMDASNSAVDDVHAPAEPIEKEGVSTSDSTSAENEVPIESGNDESENVNSETPVEPETKKTHEEGEKEENVTEDKEDELGEEKKEETEPESSEEKKEETEPKEPESSEEKKEETEHKEPEASQETENKTEHKEPEANDETKEETEHKETEEKKEETEEKKEETEEAKMDETDGETGTQETDAKKDGETGTQETNEGNAAEQGNGEVFDVEDDGKEDFTSKVMPDEDYFQTVDPDEISYYRDHPADHNKNIKCTSCHKQVTPIIGIGSGVVRHPTLGVCMCKPCRNYYLDGEWQKDEEGSDIFCRWCAEGGDLLLCDKCPAAFCKKCIQRNLGRKCLSDITSSEEWKCLICDPKQILEFRAQYHALWAHQEELKAKKLANKKEDVGQRKSMDIKEEKKRIIAPDSFMEEAFADAFKTLEAFQKSLEDERSRWIEAKMELDVDIATTITRKLRKIYAITKDSIEGIDKDLVESFSKNFPGDKMKIYLGKDDKVIETKTPKKPSPKKASPKKAVVATPRRATPSKAAPPKKKILPKKKKAPPPPASKSRSRPQPSVKTKVVLKQPVKKVVVQQKTANKKPVNGKQNYVTPSLMNMMKKKTERSGGKKRPAKDDSDSDIEILESSAPPAKKKKLGPKSKTRR